MKRLKIGNLEGRNNVSVSENLSVANKRVFREYDRDKGGTQCVGMVTITHPVFSVELAVLDSGNNPFIANTQRTVVSNKNISKSNIITFKEGVLGSVLDFWKSERILPYWLTKKGLELNLELVDGKNSTLGIEGVTYNPRNVITDNMVSKGFLGDITIETDIAVLRGISLFQQHDYVSFAMPNKVNIVGKSLDSDIQEQVEKIPTYQRYEPCYQLTELAKICFLNFFEVTEEEITNDVDEYEEVSTSTDDVAM